MLLEALQTILYGIGFIVVAIAVLISAVWVYERCEDFFQGLFAWTTVIAIGLIIVACILWILYCAGTFALWLQSLFI